MLIFQPFFRILLWPRCTRRPSFPSWQEKYFNFDSNFWQKKLLDLNVREKSRYIKVKVEHNLLFMFGPPEISWVIWGIKSICLNFLPVFYLIYPSSKQIICFDFWKQKMVLPIFYVPWEKSVKNELKVYFLWFL